MTTSMPMPTCPACGSSADRALGHASDLSFYRCGRCSLVFVDPQPRERVRQKYLAEYNLADHFEAWASRKLVLYDRRFRQLPAPSPGHDRLCDVGCADGQFLAQAAARGWKIHGVELNPPAAEAARAKGADVALGVIEEIDDLPWGTFDVVTSWDVLEHTPDPRPFSERLVRLLAPGGTLVVTTLNYDSLVRRCFGLHWSMVCDDHFTYWNPRSLRSLFESLGLKTVRESSFGLGRDFVMSLDRLAARRRPKAASTTPVTTAPASSAQWDVNPIVLGAEDLVNGALNLMHAGVGVEAAFCKQ